jgi:4-diphosphocytidyl-2-C-methyl-D-erythritol kinase
VRREAPAKVNALLRVLGRRDGGYHELHSLVLSLDLVDTLAVREARELRVVVNGPSELVEAVNTGGRNLALVAALALAESCGAEKGAEIEITKRIPVAAGLGGGSADAAAALHALNELWRCPLDLGELLDLGARVGSDVPSLLIGGPVEMSGRGERARAVMAQPTFWTIKPFAFPIRSADAYRWWDEDGATSGPDVGELLAVAASGSADALGAALFNDLEGPVGRRHPEVIESKAVFMEAGALGAIMSGSGPAVAALSSSRAEAERLSAAVPGSVVAAGQGRMG